jgi:hypothetical protein
MDERNVIDSEEVVDVPYRGDKAVKPYILHARCEFHLHTSQHILQTINDAIHETDGAAV